MSEVYPIKILLVDDKPENILAMQSILEQDGYEFRKANSAKEALKILLKEEDFALILMDVNMPEIDGFETASLIYQRQKLAHTPIIFITSNSYNEEHVFKGYECGGVDYIFKPVNPELLKIKVQVFVELSKKNRQLLLQEQKLKQINLDLEDQIKEKLQIEEELRLKNIQLSDAQKLTHLGSWEWNIFTNRIYGSEELYDIYEVNGNRDFTLDNLFSKIHPGDLENVKTSIAYAINSSNSFDIYFRMISGDGQIKYINKKGKLVKNEPDEIARVFGTTQDITDLKKKEEQLKIFNLFERMLNEIYIFTENDFNLLYANADGLRNLAYTLDDFQKCNLLDILQNYNAESFKEKIKPLLDGEKKIIFFGNFKRKDGSFYPVELHLQLIDHENKWETASPSPEKLFLAVVLDLSERKRSEQILEASLKEKEILLKEIHHRVKNNLQIISSLLNIQKSFTSNDEVLNIIDESRGRIRSMALLHEKLYQSKNFNQINFSSYIKELSESLITAYSNKQNRISLEIKSELENVNIDLGISLGLILNELITNSIKHGFKNKSLGRISVVLINKDENYYCLSVRDDGEGLPENFHINKIESLGLQLVKSLVEQIHGKLSIHNNSGVTFEIKFAADK